MRLTYTLGLIAAVLAAGCGQTSGESSLATEAVANAEVASVVSGDSANEVANLAAAAPSVEAAVEGVSTEDSAPIAATEIENITDNGEINNGENTAAPDIIGVQKGNLDATVVMVEYFSPTCGACQQFHANLMPVIETDYIDTGKILFEYRDYPLNQIDVATYSLARCTADDQGYFDLIDDFFSNQAGIREAANAGQAEVALKTVAARHDIVGDDAFAACLNDPDIREAIIKAAESGREAEVSGTPTFMVNGVTYKYSEMYSEAALRKILDDAILAAAAPEVSD